MTAKKLFLNYLLFVFLPLPALNAVLAENKSPFSPGTIYSATSADNKNYSPPNIIYEDPETLLSDFLENVFVLIQKDIEIEDQIDEFSTWFHGYIDIKNITRLAVGPRWGGFSDQQKIDFQKVFVDFLLVNFFPKTKMLSRGEIQIKRAIKAKERRYIIVSVFLQEEGYPIKLEWDIYKCKGQHSSYKIVNLTAEGVSFILQMKGLVNVFFEKSKTVEEAIELMTASTEEQRTRLGKITEDY